MSKVSFLDLGVYFEMAGAEQLMLSTFWEHFCESKIFPKIVRIFLFVSMYDSPCDVTGPDTDTITLYWYFFVFLHIYK